MNEAKKKKDRILSLIAIYFWQVLVLLFLAAVSVDLIDAEIWVRAIAECHRRAGTTQFLLDDDMVEVSATGAPVLLFHGYTQQSEFSEFLPKRLPEIKKDRNDESLFKVPI